MNDDVDARSRERQLPCCNLWEEIVKLQSREIPFLWSNIVETWLKEKLSAISNIQIRKSVSIRLGPNGRPEPPSTTISGNWVHSVSNFKGRTFCPEEHFYFFLSAQQFRSRWTDSINPSRLPLIAAFHLRSCSLKSAVPSIINSDGLGSSDESQQK